MLNPHITAPLQKQLRDFHRVEVVAEIVDDLLPRKNSHLRLKGFESCAQAYLIPLGIERADIELFQRLLPGIRISIEGPFGHGKRGRLPKKITGAPILFLPQITQAQFQQRLGAFGIQAMRLQECLLDHGPRRTHQLVAAGNTPAGLPFL